MQPVISIGIGAFLGALLRWKLGEYFNHVFPTIPLGTLASNLLGSFLMGGIIFYSVEHTFFSYEVRLGLITGFLGSLTTFSTFSAEAWSLLSRHEFFWFAAHLGLHLAGTIMMVALGYIISKSLFQTMGA